jgi:hypothetical protein
MRKPILTAALVAALAAPAAAATYPVSGRWGESSSSKPGTIDCSGKRVIDFTGNTRTDSGGSVRGYQNQSVISDGNSQYRIIDIFSNGQISSGQVSYTLRQVDPDHIEIQMQQGGMLKLQRCN